ncbi:RNA-binding protein 33-like isoform X2 [Brienomyrus brachyistius]|uniref:RNA-binding protein 33-like isoform X2 n=1 Tax=Brienomyrus brachyistius TaxID=42636 RepID=UPI0020B284B6|nr:RNA-binding protein 33-like isoform X2 [Brienomyrus brachyistius]
MAGSARGDDFDECDEPGGTRWCEWMRDDDNSGSLIVPQSELEGDFFEDEWLAPKQTLSDMQDEELDDDLLHSDNDSPSPGVTAGLDSTFDPNSQTSTKVGRPGGDEGPGVVREDDRAGTPTDGGVSAEDVVDIGIGGSLDNEFQVDDGFSGVIRSVPIAVKVQETVEDEADRGETSEAVSEEEENERWIEELKGKPELSEEEDEEEDQESHRLRFKTERKDASAVPLSAVADKRRNIPETLELSEEAAAALYFQATARTRGRLGGRGRGGRTGCCTARLQDVGHRGQGALSLRPPRPPGSFSLAASQARGSWRSPSPIQDTSLSHSQAATSQPPKKLQSADSPLSGWAKMHRTSSQWHHLVSSKQLFPPSGLTCPPQSARLGKQGFINLLPRPPIRNRTTRLVPQPCPLMPPLSHSTPLQQAQTPIRQAYGSVCQASLPAPPPPAAQVRPFARQPPSTQEVPVCTAKAECKPGVHPGRGAPADLSQKSGPEGSGEEEEARRYGQKLEEQRCLRERLLQHKELRRRQQAEMRKKELLQQLARAPPAGCEPQVRPLMVHSLPAAAPSSVRHLGPPTSAPFRLNAAQQVSSGMPVSPEQQLCVTISLPSQWRSPRGPGPRWTQRYSPPPDQRAGLKRIVTRQGVSHPLKVRVVQLLEVQAAGGDGNSRPRKQTSQERNVTLRRSIQPELTTPGGRDGEGAPPTNWIEPGEDRGNQTSEQRPHAHPVGMTGSW